MNIIILAGGYGTRIQSISKGIPKPLMPVGDRLFLDFIFDWLSIYKVEKVILSLHYKPQAFLSYIKKIKNNSEVIPVIEPNPMGTGGAVKYIIDNLDITEKFGVINGDTLVNFNLLDMYKKFISINSPAMIALSYVKNSSRYGNVKYKDYQAESFIEKKVKSSGWINNGCYFFKKEIFNNFYGSFSIENDFFPELVRRNKLSVYPTKGKFWDIGTNTSYKKFINKFSNNKILDKTK